MRECKLACRSKGSRNADKRKATEDKKEKERADAALGPYRADDPADRRSNRQSRLARRSKARKRAEHESGTQHCCETIRHIPCWCRRTRV